MALRKALQLQINYMQKFCCENAWDSLNSFPGSGLIPKFIIMDVQFYPAIGSAPEAWSETKWMVLVKDENDGQLLDALFAGANSFFVLKKEPAELCIAIENLMESNGNEEMIKLIRNLSPANKEKAKNRPNYNLTYKESQILQLMTEGLHFKAIAVQMGSTYETIRTHVKRIYKKLQVGTASEAVVKAFHMNEYNGRL